MIKKLEIQNSIIYFSDSSIMSDVENDSVALIVTSPPYFNYIEYGKIGIGTELVYKEYLNSLNSVFKECLRVLIPDGKICLNITNMKSRKDVEGKSFLYSIVADVTKIMMDIGFIFFDEIIWIKANANNGALKGKPLFGSYPYPPTPKILDSIFENILIFKKDGRLIQRVDKETKESSKVSKEDWMQYTKGIWNIEPDRNSPHPASFPIELPKRLIKIYSFKNETVLDPFAGTGSTLVAANLLERKAIGYEIFEEYEKFISQRFSTNFDQTELFEKII